MDGSVPWMVPHLPVDEAHDDIVVRPINRLHACAGCQVPHLAHPTQQRSMPSDIRRTTAAVCQTNLTVLSACTLMLPPQSAENMNWLTTTMACTGWPWPPLADVKATCQSTHWRLTTLRESSRPAELRHHAMAHILNSRRNESKCTAGLKAPVAGSYFHTWMQLSLLPLNSMPLTASSERMWPCTGAVDCITCHMRKLLLVLKEKHPSYIQAPEATWGSILRWAGKVRTACG
jgi:hypothetical protein